jgi:hypothetical protein
MPVTVPKPRQAFPVQHSDEDANEEFHDGLFGFVFDAVHDVTDEEYAVDRANVSFASSGWAAGEHGGFPLRTVIGDTPQFKLRERTEGKRICSSLPSGSPDAPRTWFSLSLPEHTPCFQPTHYRLRHGRGSGFCALRSWDLLGSRDGGRWFLLKSHRDESLLQAAFAVATFRVWSDNVDEQAQVVCCCLPHCRAVVAPLVQQHQQQSQASSPAGHGAYGARVRTCVRARACVK